MAGIGFWELVLILVFALVLFGPRRLPEIGRALGKGIREFQDAVRGVSAGEEPRAEPLQPMGAPPAGDVQRGKTS